MTQAQGPATAQVQQPAHPIHEEQAMHERLTNLVKNTQDNDPHEGTELAAPKAPQAEEAPAEEQAAEAPAEETLELDEDAPIFEVPDTEDKTKTVKVSLKQLREERMMKADYHRNIQKVKAQEAQIQEQVRTETQKAQQEYLQRLEVQKQAVVRLAGVKSMQQIEELSKTDPAGAQQEFLKMLSANQVVQTIENEQRQAFEKFQHDQRAALEQAKLKSRETLETKVKGWSEDLYGKILSSAVKDYGFKNEEVEPVVDARLIEVFHDAYQFRQLQKAKPEISKKVVAVPKVVKPGSGQPAASSSTADEAASRLKKSGKGEDFVAWYIAQQKQQKRK